MAPSQRVYARVAERSGRRRNGTGTPISPGSGRDAGGDEIGCHCAHRRVGLRSAPPPCLPRQFCHRQGQQRRSYRPLASCPAPPRLYLCDDQPIRARDGVTACTGTGWLGLISLVAQGGVEHLSDPGCCCVSDVLPVRTFCRHRIHRSRLRARNPPATTRGTHLRAVAVELLVCLPPVWRPRPPTVRLLRATSPRRWRRG